MNNLKFSIHEKINIRSYYAPRLNRFLYPYYVLHTSWSKWNEKPHF